MKWAREYTDDVEFSPEDAGRSEPDFLCRLVEAAISAGATTINIPDTVGYTMPWQFGVLIASLRNLARWQPRNLARVLAYFGERGVGTAYGFIFFISCIGMGLGSYAGGAIHDTLGTYAWLFVASGLIGGMAFVLATSLRAPAGVMGRLDASSHAV